MSEEQPKETNVEEAEPKALTQEDLNNAITARLGREQKKHEAELEAANQRANELEQKLQQKSASEMTDSEHRAALQKSLEQTRAELEEFKQTVAQKEEAEIVGKLDMSDKDALLEAGFNPKYSQVVLGELKKVRGFENGVAFYKDGEGAAINREQAISNLTALYPELVMSGRVKGNDVHTRSAGPAVDPSKETTEQYIARRERERAAQNQ